VSPDQQIAHLEAKIAEAELRILRIKDELAELADALTNLSLDAADRRASNALQGRGLGGMLFGAKYRGVARRAASADNAKLSQEVARRKREIVVTKQQLKAQERTVRLGIAELKQDLRSAKSLARRTQSAPVEQSDDVGPGRLSKDELKLKLQKLKSLYERGELTAVQYEQERIMLLSPFT
jgi:chromosome segregation ATPase